MSDADQEQDEVGRLIGAYLDDTLTDAEADQLRAHLRDDPRLLIELSRMAQLVEHTRTLLAEQSASESQNPDSLLTALAALAAGEEDAELVHLDTRAQPRRPITQAGPTRPNTPFHEKRIIIIPRALAYAAVLVVVGGVLIGVMSLFPAQTSPDQRPAVADQPEPPPARLDRARDARWTGLVPGTDGAMKPGMYRLDHGFAELTFANGAGVLIQGPSTFELISGSRMELRTGMASAHVPDGAEGFTIVSPAGEFIDLGTRFGVDISGFGEAELHVFEGKVEARPRTKSLEPPPIIRGGEAVAVDAVKPRPEPLVFRPEKFAQTWDATRTGVEVTESIRLLFKPPTSVRTHELEHNHQVFMFAERRGVVLDDRLKVSFTEPGRYVRFEKKQGFVPAQSRVDSYFVHFDRVGRPSDNQLIPISGVITFDRPVLGVIVHDQLLDASSDLFKLDQTLYPTRAVDRGLEYRPGKNADPNDLSSFQDLVQIDDDRRTVRLHLETSSNIDQLRILVEAEAP